MRRRGGASRPGQPGRRSRRRHRVRRPGVAVRVGDVVDAVAAADFAPAGHARRAPLFLWMTFGPPLCGVWGVLSLSLLFLWASGLLATNSTNPASLSDSRHAGRSHTCYQGCAQACAQAVPHDFAHTQPTVTIRRVHAGLRSSQSSRVELGVELDPDRIAVFVVLELVPVVNHDPTVAHGCRAFCVS